MTAPKLKTPPGACDCHMHFYDARFPTAPTAIMTPPDAGPADYRAMRDALRLSRVVVVQPSTYGLDNTCTMEGVKDAELDRLTKGGICAIRITTLRGGMLGFDVMDELMARVHPFRWHANIQLDGRELPRVEAQIKRLPGKFVFDHTGKFLEPVAPEHEAFKSLLRLVDTGRCWVKQSAPYETSKTGAPGYDDVGAIAKALVKAAPERCLWASNWPHPGRETPPDDAALLDLLLDWAPNERIRRDILVDNPARLYNFV